MPDSLQISVAKSHYRSSKERFLVSQLPLPAQCVQQISRYIILPKRCESRDAIKEPQPHQHYIEVTQRLVQVMLTDPPCHHCARRGVVVEMPTFQIQTCRIPIGVLTTYIRLWNKNNQDLINWGLVGDTNLLSGSMQLPPHLWHQGIFGLLQWFQWTNNLRLYICKQKLINKINVTINITSVSAWI